MQYQNKLNYVFDFIERFLKTTYNIDSELLSQLVRFQKNYVIDYRELNSLPVTQDFDYDFWGHLVFDQPLNKSVRYQFDTAEDKSMSLDRFLENIYFGRKRNFGKATITGI